MDPYSEQTLRNQVIFLHSLWHQGPPQPPQHHHFLHPQNPPIFNNPRNPKKMKTQQNFDVSTSEWPCPSPPESNPSVWPSFPTTHFPSEAEIHFSSVKVQAWDVGNRMQLRVVQEVKKFFKNQKDESDDDEVEDDDVEMEGDDSDEESGDDYLGFFLKLFEENGELREFYVKNYENGEFGCLVCGGVGFIRRFKDCVALVQHTLSISKTKKMKAHRAFGKVVCEVLGWDIDKLPSIASFISEKRNAASSKVGEDQHEVQEINEALNVENHDNETGEKEFAGADQLPDNGALAVAEEEVTNEVHDVQSHDKETGEKEFAGAEQLPDNDALAVAEIVGGDDGIATNLKEHAADIEQGNIECSLDCLEAGLGNGSKAVSSVDRNIAVSSVDRNVPAETKGNEAIGDEKLPTSDTSNPAQMLQSSSGIGGIVNDLLEENLDGKQENAESTSN